MTDTEARAALTPEEMGDLCVLLSRATPEQYRLALAALPDDGQTTANHDQVSRTDDGREQPVIIDEMHVWSPGWETKLREELEQIAATTSSPATASRLRKVLSDVHPPCDQECECWKRGYHYGRD